MPRLRLPGSQSTSREPRRLKNSHGDAWPPVVAFVYAALRLNFNFAYQRFPVDRFVDRFVNFLFACAKSDPATLLTVALLLFLKSLAALLASLFDVAISIILLMMWKESQFKSNQAALCRAACIITQLLGSLSILSAPAGCLVRIRLRTFSGTFVRYVRPRRSQSPDC
jgi:hypothetical protein